MGKAYANKKSTDKQPKVNFYPTPKSLVWVVESVIFHHFDMNKPVLEPCCGNGAISTELINMGYYVEENDLFATNPNFTCNEYVITNPPFSLWDEFVNKAKSE